LKIHKQIKIPEKEENKNEIKKEFKINKRK